MGSKGVNIPQNGVKIGQFGVSRTHVFGTGSNHIYDIVDLVPKGVQNLVPLLYPKMDHPGDLLLEHFWHSYIGDKLDWHQYGGQNWSPKGSKIGSTEHLNLGIPP